MPPPCPPYGCWWNAMKTRTGAGGSFFLLTISSIFFSIIICNFLIRKTNSLSLLSVKRCEKLLTNRWGFPGIGMAILTTPSIQEAGESTSKSGTGLTEAILTNGTKCNQSIKTLVHHRLLVRVRWHLAVSGRFAVESYLALNVSLAKVKHTVMSTCQHNSSDQSLDFDIMYCNFLCSIYLSLGSFVICTGVTLAVVLLVFNVYYEICLVFVPFVIVARVVCITFEQLMLQLQLSVDSSKNCCLASQRSRYTVNPFPLQCFSCILGYRGWNLS